MSPEGRMRLHATLAAEFSKWANAQRQFLYDWWHNVETWPPVLLDQLRIDSENRVHGVRYDPESPSRFERILKTVSARFDGFTFVDLGCGKGRVLFLASHYPFRKIIGVEFSSELARVAQENVDKYRPRKRPCTNLSVLCMDAAEYKLPEGPLFIYMYNPFRAPVMQQVLARIKYRSEVDRSPLYVAYTLPLQKQILKDSGFLVPIAETATFCMFQAQPGPR